MNEQELAGATAVTIPTECPHCGKQYRLKDKYAGKNVTCRVCDEKFRVARKEAHTAGFLTVMCKQCGYIQETQVDHSGKLVECRKCKEWIRVPITPPSSPTPITSPVFDVPDTDETPLSSLQDSESQTHDDIANFTPTEPSRAAPSPAPDIHPSPDVPSKPPTSGEGPAGSASDDVEFDCPTCHNRLNALRNDVDGPGVSCPHCQTIVHVIPAELPEPPAAVAAPPRWVNHHKSRDFKKNPFLILGVSADAEMREIKQVAQRSLMELRLDGQEKSESARRIEQALETLQDPVQRFEWGLFWPELTPTESQLFRTDPILSTLAENPLQNAVAAYQLISESTSIEIRSHNFGVLSLLCAVARTEQAQMGTPDDTKDDLACISIWKRTFRHLKQVVDQVVESERFWMRQRLRAKELQDPRLNAELFAKIRAGFLGEILAPLGTVITTALLAGHANVATVYVGLLRQSGFEKQSIEDTLSNVYKPLADRIEENVNQLEQRLGKLDEAADQESECGHLLNAFERDVLRDLKVMLSVGDLPGSSEKYVRDKAAEFLRSLGISAWNETKNHQVSRKAVRLAGRIAHTGSLKATVTDDASDLKAAHIQDAKAQKLAPLFKQLDVALNGKKLTQAIGVIDKLIALTAAKERSDLESLRRRVSSSLATELFNKAIEQVNAQHFEKAHKLLNSALAYETDPSEQRIIRSTIAQIPLERAYEPRQSTGCLVAIVAWLTMLVVASLAGGTLYAHIQ